MNAVDGSVHFDVSSKKETPSLCTVIIDTNRGTWAAHTPVVPFSSVIATLLIFVNAHLALSNENQVAIIASHSDRAVLLYPTPPGRSPSILDKRKRPREANSETQNDVDMLDDG